VRSMRWGNVENMICVLVNLDHFLVLLFLILHTESVSLLNTGFKHS
jgi:hypothetical protein